MKPRISIFLGVVLLILLALFLATRSHVSARDPKIQSPTSNSEVNTSAISPQSAHDVPHVQSEETKSVSANICGFGSVSLAANADAADRYVETRSKAAETLWKQALLDCDDIRARALGLALQFKGFGVDATQIHRIRLATSWCHPASRGRLPPALSAGLGKDRSEERRAVVDADE